MKKIIPIIIILILFFKIDVNLAKELTLSEAILLALNNKNNFLLDEELFYSSPSTNLIFNTNVGLDSVNLSLNYTVYDCNSNIERKISSINDEIQKIKNKELKNTIIKDIYLTYTYLIYYSRIQKYLVQLSEICDQIKWVVEHENLGFLEKNKLELDAINIQIFSNQNKRNQENYLLHLQKKINMFDSFEIVSSYPIQYDKKFKQKYSHLFETKTLNNHIKLIVTSLEKEKVKLRLQKENLSYLPSISINYNLNSPEYTSLISNLGVEIKSHLQIGNFHINPQIKLNQNDQDIYISIGYRYNPNKLLYKKEIDKLNVSYQNWIDYYKRQEDNYIKDLNDTLLRIYSIEKLIEREKYILESIAQQSNIIDLLSSRKNLLKLKLEYESCILEINHIVIELLSLRNQLTINDLLSKSKNSTKSKADL